MKNNRNDIAFQIMLKLIEAYPLTESTSLVNWQNYIVENSYYLADLWIVRGQSKQKVNFSIQDREEMDCHCGGRMVLIKNRNHEKYKKWVCSECDNETYFQKA